MPRVIDLHTHILPGVDDGVRTEDDAVEFARVAAADGIRTLVATPHCKEGFYTNERTEVLAGVDRLRARLAAENVPVDVLPGAEVHLCTDLVARVRDGRAPTLADNGKTLLLELSTTQYPVEIDNLVFELRLAGIIALFAHPERVRFFLDDVRRYEALVRLGAYGQITSGSILGIFGEEIREFSEELLRKRLVHVVASDSHNVRGRPPQIRSAIEAIVPWVGERTAMGMATDIPRALLEGRDPDLPAPPEDTAARKRSLLSRLFQKR